MFNLCKGIVLAITAAGSISVIGKSLKKKIDNQYLDKYGMTAKEYVDAVMESKSIEEYRNRLSR